MVRQRKVIAEKGNVFSDAIKIWIAERIDNEHYSYLSNLEFETVGIAEYKETPLNLTPTEAQELMDSLWSCGLRPSYGHTSSGQLEAIQNHLIDSQGLVNRLLEMVEKKWTK